MPNWCENDLTVRGPKAEVQRFLDHVKTETTKFDFSTIIPYPEKFQKLDKIAADWKPESKTERPSDGFNSGGYEWCIENWGTKWNNLDGEYRSVEIESWEVREKDIEREVIFHFDTAWSPPVPVIKFASKLFPELDFDLRFFEQGCAFNGILQVKDGKVAMEKVGDYFGNRGG